MPKTPARHGTRSRYVTGCTDGTDGKACEPCKLAEANYQKKRRRGVVGNVIPLTSLPVAPTRGDDPQPLPYTIGPVEQGVIDVLAKFPAAGEARPDLAASARAMARIQDSAITVAQATNAARQMREIQGELLKGQQKKRKLAAVRQMTSPTTATG